jgi:sulfate adenylyltransferase subunit 2
MMPENDMTHLERLEAESIHIMREVAAEFANPVMLYSIGKDSSVMLHLALKAFYPATPPFPLLHIDTTWKFREMIAFRDQAARRAGMELLVQTNQDGISAGITPFTPWLRHLYQRHEDRRAEAGVGTIRLRRGLRRRPAR